MGLNAVVGGAGAAPAAVGKAYRFNGADERIDSPSAYPALLSTGFSVGGWFKWSGGAAWQVPFWRQNGNAIVGLRIQSGTTYLAWTNNSANGVFAAGPAFPSGTWTHVGISCDSVGSNMRMRLYFDGALVSTQTSSQVPVLITGLLGVGTANGASFSWPWAGDAYDLAAWASTSIDWAALHAGTQTPADQPSCQMWWSAQASEDLTAAGGVIDRSTLETADGTAYNMTTAANLVGR